MATVAELRKSTTELVKTVYGPKSFYAVAGVTDLAVEVVKSVPSKAQKLRAELLGTGETKGKVTEYQSKYTTKVSEYQTKVTDTVKGLPADAKATATKLGEKADAQVKAADTRYADLTVRGEEIVKRLRSQKATKDLLSQAQSTVTKARQARGAAVRGTKNTTTAAKGTVTSAKKTAELATKAAAAAGAKIGD
jgi:hypothetical protein